MGSDDETSIDDGMAVMFQYKRGQVCLHMLMFLHSLVDAVENNTRLGVVLDFNKISMVYDESCNQLPTIGHAFTCK